jgi:nucleoside-diphosphate-sugar epimerase
VSGRVLVTGGSGFIGREALAPLAALGFEVQVVGRTPVAGAAKSRTCDLLSGDLDRLLDEAGPTHLLHLAWFVEPGAFWTSPLNDAWAAASLRLLDAFAAHGGQRVVIAGTCAEYDWSCETLSERLTPLHPRTPYGRAKAALYEAAMAAAARVGVSLGWGRIGFPFGPLDRPQRLISGAIDRMSAGEPFDCSEGRQVRPFIHAPDVGAAMAQLLASPVEGAVNIATEETASVRQMIDWVAEALGVQGLARFGALPTAADEPPRLTPEVRRLYDEVGFRPRSGLRQAVARTVTERVARRV